eukprot:s739_g16.t1
MIVTHAQLPSRKAQRSNIIFLAARLLQHSAGQHKRALHDVRMDAGAAKYLEDNVGGVLAKALAEMAKEKNTSNVLSQAICHSTWPFQHVRSSSAMDSTASSKVGFITEVAQSTAEEELLEHTPSTSSRPRAVSLPTVNVYNVEFAELPNECYGGGLASPAPLPASIPMDKIMSNIAQNLDFKGWSEQARNLWFKDFKSQCSRAVIQDTFWFCICWYFKPGKHLDVETRLFDRISANFVGLFSSLNPSRKDMTCRLAKSRRAFARKVGYR